MTPFEAKAIAAVTGAVVTSLLSECRSAVATRPSVDLGVEEGSRLWRPRWAGRELSGM